jgi:hypothetical protein
MRKTRKPKYDYDMLARAKFYRRFLPDKAMRRGFVSEMSFNSIWFKSGEQTYERELKV